MKRITVMGSSAVISLCTACSSTPVPVSVAISTIEHDFQHAGSIGLSAVAAGGGFEKGIFQKQVHDRQCFYRTSDPIMAATVKDFSVALSGTFTDTGKATIGTVTAVPAVGLEFDVAEGKTQTVTLPVTFAPLSDLPRIYFSQQLSYLSAIPSTTTPGSDIDIFRKNQYTKIVKNANKLDEYVTEFQNSYDPKNCEPNVQLPGPVLEEYQKMVPAQ
jgi:hypothetical protein